MSIGAGKHNLISEENGLVFSRVKDDDKVVVGINLPKGDKEIKVASIFNDGDTVTDFYSNQDLEVKNGNVVVNSDFDIVLLEKK